MTTQPDGRPRTAPRRDYWVRPGWPRQPPTPEHRRPVSAGGWLGETHAEMLETMLRLESELDRRGQGLADVNPTELADIAWRIDSPELHAMVLRLKSELERLGRAFEDLTAEE